MRLLRLEPIHVPVNERGGWLLLRLHRNGHTACGDGTSSGDDAACAALWTGELTDLLTGQDLLDTDARADELMAWATERGGDRLAATAASAVEQALWDLRGRAEGRAICELLGGRRRSEIQLYANINRGTRDRSPAGFAERARQAVAAGFDALKIAPFDEVTHHLSPAKMQTAIEAGLRRIAAVRGAVGADIVLRVDAHHRFDLDSAITVGGRLAEWDVDWFEEATHGLDPKELAEVRRQIPLRTAGGEGLFGLDRFQQWLAAHAVDFVMPDVKQCGGLREAMRVARLAAERGVGFSPHNPHSPIGTAFSLHVCAAAPEMERLEYQFAETEWSRGMITPKERPKNGRLRVPTEPGLGVELREAALSRAREVVP